MRAGSMVLIAALGLLVSVEAAPSAAQDATPRKYLELLRSDVRAAKTGLMTEALDLTPAQSEAFWPLYRAYDTELAGLGDRRVALIKQFADGYGTLTDAQADEMADAWFALQQDRADLRRKYHGRVAKAVSPRIAARFVQVDHVVSMLLDLQIAAELPLIE